MYENPQFMVQIVGQHFRLMAMSGSVDMIFYGKFLM